MTPKFKKHENLKQIGFIAWKRIGASEGIQTLDTHVGNVMLYQAELRSLPAAGRQPSKNPRLGKHDFRPAWACWPASRG